MKLERNQGLFVFFRKRMSELNWILWNSWWWKYYWYEYRQHFCAPWLFIFTGCRFDEECAKML